MKKELKLYNVLFPFWLLKYLSLPICVIVILGNFALDSLVLFVAMSILRIELKWDFYKSAIWKIFVFGLLADIMGSALMLSLGFAGVGRMLDEPYLTAPALIISSICIFLFNYFISFKRCEKELRISLALTFAIVTAPYTFLVPSTWLYG